MPLFVAEDEHSANRMLAFCPEEVWFSSRSGVCGAKERVVASQITLCGAEVGWRQRAQRVGGTEGDELGGRNGVSGTIGLSFARK